jgi:hypothetical protein
MRRYPQRDLRRHRLRFAPKWDVYIGVMRSQFNGGLANAFFENNNVATTAGLRFKY